MSKVYKSAYYKAKEIQEDGNNLLRTTVNKFRYSLSDVFWIFRNEEDQLDKGVDFQYELEDKLTGQSIQLFKIQNKGTAKALTPIKGAENKGLIAYSLSLRNAKYYRYEIPVALIFTVSDVKNNKVYWHPVQLDDSIDEKIVQAEKLQKRSISLYINPQNILNNDTAIDFIKAVHESYLQQTVRFQQYAKHPLLTLATGGDFKVDRTKPFLDQVYDYISHTFKEVSNIPIHLFTRKYPFKKEQPSSCYYGTFRLTTDNEELFEFFESFKIESNQNIVFLNNKFTDKVENYLEKTKAILKKLTSNLIFHIELEKKSKVITIRYNEESVCDCIRCCFLRFDFTTALGRLSEPTNTLEEKCRLAYVHYQVGNLITAVNLMKEISIESKKQKKNIRSFISQFNLSKLYYFSRFRYWGTEHVSLFEELKSIDLNSEYSKLSNEGNKQFLEWIKSNSFYSDSIDDISKTVSKIKDQYYSQLYGGWSSNNDVWILYNQYAQIDMFLNHNFIIYDGFDEFKQLTEIAMEGLFASHAIDKAHKSRFEKFDDWILKEIIFYGKPERILEYIKRYKIKEIVYEHTSTEGDSLLELFKNFLSSSSTIKSAIEKYCEKDNTYFRERYNTIFSNLLVISAFCNLTKEQGNEIFQGLITFLENENLIYPVNFKYLRAFINKKGRLIERNLIESFFRLVMSNRKLHNQELIEATLEQLESGGGFRTSKEECIKILEIAFDKCPVCQGNHSPEFAVSLYDAVEDPEIKFMIKGSIEKKLALKYHSDLYYVAALYGVLDSKGTFFDQLVEKAKPEPNRASFRKIFTGIDDNRYPNVNALINLCYRNNIDLTNQVFDGFRGLDPYYDWLLNMKTFDYSLFNPRWVSEYPTKHYFEQIRKHPIIREKILNYVKNNHAPQLEENFIGLYGDQTNNH